MEKSMLSSLVPFSFTPTPMPKPPEWRTDNNPRREPNHTTIVQRYPPKTEESTLVCCMLYALVLMSEVARLHDLIQQETTILSSGSHNRYFSSNPNTSCIIHITAMAKRYIPVAFITSANSSRDICSFEFFKTKK